MPVSISKNKGGYSVRTPGGVKSKKTSAKNAMAQKRLLMAVEHGWKPGKSKKSNASMPMKKMVMKMRVAKHMA